MAALSGEIWVQCSRVAIAGRLAHSFFLHHVQVSIVNIKPTTQLVRINGFSGNRLENSYARTKNSKQILLNAALETPSVDTPPSFFFANCANSIDQTKKCNNARRNLTNLGEYTTETEERGVHVILRQNVVCIVRLLYKIAEEEPSIVEGFLAGRLSRHQFKYLNFRRMHEQREEI